MDTELHNKIELFFRHPLIAPNIRRGHPETLSVLFLLRRDIQGCLNDRRYLIPATMTMLAGIDLLGKFYAGDDDRNGVTRRFEGFVSVYFQPIAPGDAKVIYALRNALLHSFSLYSEGRNFMLAETHASGDLVVTEPDNTLIIAASTLYIRLEKAIEQYHAELTTSEILQQKFTHMFDNYGLTHVGIA